MSRAPPFTWARCAALAPLRARHHALCVASLTAALRSAWQTYECLRDHDNAYKWYKRRFDLGGWAEEAYEAKFRMGRVAGYLGKPWPDVQQLWLDAHAYLPARAEPLYAIAQHYFQKDKNYPLAFLFAQRASQIPCVANARAAHRIRTAHCLPPRAGSPSTCACSSTSQCTTSSRTTCWASWHTMWASTRLASGRCAAR